MGNIDQEGFLSEDLKNFENSNNAKYEPYLVFTEN